MNSETDPSMFVGERQFFMMRRTNQRQRGENNMTSSRQLCAFLTTTAVDWGIGTDSLRHIGCHHSRPRHDARSPAATGEKTSRRCSRRPAAPYQQS
jgi:hypothetical protein